MTDRPITFSGPMVRALLDGRKVQTRRLATSPLRKCAVGDRLYVRETWTRSAMGLRDLLPTYYRADGESQFMGEMSEAGGTRITRTYTDHWTLNGERHDDSGWKPSIHMPRWASRLTLVVTATKTERLQAISEQDAKAEGVPHPMFVTSVRVGNVGHDYRIPDSFRGAFCSLWNDLHGNDAWPSNPEVVALTFTVHHRNIDAMDSP